MARWWSVLILVAGCGNSGGAAPDAPPDRDAPEVDARPPPACDLAEDGGCRECVVGAARSASTSACTAAVCAIDDGCCAAIWAERCTELADALCEPAACVDAVTISGEGGVTVAFPDGDGWDGDAWPVPSAGGIHAIAWADALDDDGDADLILAGDCRVHVFRNLGWSGGILELESALELEPMEGCELEPPDPAVYWHGRRARWADAEGDGDLDGFFVGNKGVVWAENAGGDLVYRGEIIPADRVMLDGLFVDLDGDEDVDAVIGHDDGPARFYHQDDGVWTAGDPLSEDDQVYATELCHLRGDAGPAVVIGGYGGTQAFQLDGDPYFPGGPDVPGVGLAFEVACGDLDGDHVDELVVGVAGEAPYVAIARWPAGAVWSSAVDLDPALGANAFGLDVGDLDGDGDNDVAAQLALPDSVSPFVVLVNEGDLTFTQAPGVDVIADRPAERIELVRLGRP